MPRNQWPRRKRSTKPDPAAPEDGQGGETGLDDDGGGPSALFWIVCIVFGVGLGIGAFMLIRGLV